MRYICPLRYSVEIAYEGTHFSGWQRQADSPTIQQTLEEALAVIFREEMSIVGCGRTDAGVHASQYFFHCDPPKEFTDDLVFRLNNFLPPQIAILGFKKVDDMFHARFDAVSRSYTYKVHTIKDPFLINKSAYIQRKLKLNEMQACCEFLLDAEDFASFCKAGSDNKTTLCKVSRAFWESDGSHLSFHISADRFLRNMVRAIVGTMLEVGYGQRSIEDFKNILRSGDRSAAGKSAAACGLYLSNIEY